MSREKPPTRLAPKNEVVAIREIRTIADVIRELDLVHGKHITKDESDEFFQRISNAIADLPAKHFTNTSITLFIDDVEYTVTLQPVGNNFALAVTKTHH